jgi:hypothetical protein
LGPRENLTHVTDFGRPRLAERMQHGKAITFLATLFR